MTKTTDDLQQSLNQLVPNPVAEIECPMERAMDLVGDKYSLLIIHILMQFQPQRFVELEEQIVGISPRTLSARLKHLYRHGLIERRQFPTIPPRVEYTLTERGQALAGVLDGIQVWANTHYPFKPAASSVRPSVSSTSSPTP